jgi:hypothetical protein
LMKDSGPSDGKEGENEEDVEEEDEDNEWTYYYLYILIHIYINFINSLKLQSPFTKSNLYFFSSL